MKKHTLLFILLLISGYALADMMSNVETAKSFMENFLYRVDFSLKKDTADFIKAVSARGLTKTEHLGLNSIVKSQGKRNTCSAFATVGAMEGFLKKQNINVDLSEQYIYYNLKKAYVPAMDGLISIAIPYYLKKMGKLCTVEESDWPYVNDPVPGNVPQGPPPSDLDDVKHYCIEDTVYLPADVMRNVQTVKMILAAGYQIIVNYNRPDAAAVWSPADKRIKASPTDGKINTSNQHFVLLSGFKANGDLIIKNSWGDKWLDKGYGYVTADYHTKYTTEGVVVTNVKVYEE